MTAQVDPYKYETFSSVEPWLWDPFSFRFGVIRNYGRLTYTGALDAEHSIAVNGAKVLTAIGSPMPTTPVFYAISSDGNGISVSYKGTTYPLFLVDAEHTVEGHNVIEGPQTGPVNISRGDVDFNWHTGGMCYPAIEIPDGEQSMRFTGNGAVAVEYRGGRL